MNPTPEKLAERCYYIYGSVTDFKNYQGLPMPKWEDLPEIIQEAWKASSQYAFKLGVSSIVSPKLK